MLGSIPIAGQVETVNKILKAEAYAWFDSYHQTSGNPK